VSRSVGLLCAGLVACLMAGPGSAASPQWWRTVRASSGISAAVAPGVSFSRYRLLTAHGPIRLYRLRVDLSVPTVRLGLGLAHEQLISRDETVSSMVGRTRAVAGVNGDFFDIGDSGMPLNIVVQNGALLRSPSSRAALAVGKDGSAAIVRYEWDGSLLLPDTRTTYWIAGFNTGLVPDGITALSNARGYGAPPPAPGVRQTVVELAPGDEAQPASADSGFSLVAEPSPIAGVPYRVKQVWPGQAFYAPFPKDELLLVGRGRASDWLRDHVTAGAAALVNLATRPDWRTTHLAIGGGPLLVQHGRVVDDPRSPAPHERDVRHPVLGVGILPDGHTMLLVGVDGRQPHVSVGLTQPELASYLQWLGVDQAMAFDSGGSVTMVVRFPWRPAPTIVNSPSDGRERPVGDALLVFEMPANRPVLVGGNRAPRLSGPDPGHAVSFGSSGGAVRDGSHE